MNLQNLGSKIKAERQIRGITQEQLAEKVDISTNFMSLIENGRNMSVETLVRIAYALGVSIDYLLSDTVEVYSDKIIAQIIQNMSDFNDEEKFYFLNMVKQYKSLRNSCTDGYK